MSAGGESVVRTQQITVDPSFNSIPDLHAELGLPARARPGPRQAAPDHDVVRGRRRRPPELHPRRARPAARHRHRVQRRHHLHLRPRLHRHRLDRLRRERRPRRHRHGDLLGRRRRAGRADLRDARPVDVRTGARRTVALQLLRRLRRPARLPDHRRARARDARPAGRRAEPAPHLHRGRRAGQRHVLLPRDERQRDGEHRHPGPPPRPPTANVAPSCAGNAGFPEAVPGGRDVDARARSARTTTATTLGYAKLSEPAHGTLTDAGGTLVYTPARRLLRPRPVRLQGDRRPRRRVRHGHAPRQRRRAGPADLRAERAIALRPNTSRTSSSTATTRPAARSPT